MAAIGILGAGPAGSVAAIALAQLGHRVTLFERAAFPRDKVCGECLSAMGIGVLRRLGVADAFQRDLQPVLLTHARAVAWDDSSLDVALPEPMWGLTRRTMDDALVAIARYAGVDVRLQTTAALADGPNVSLRDGAATRSSALQVLLTHRSNTPATLSQDAFDFVLLADGGATLGRGEPTGDFGIKTHFVNVEAPRDTIELVALATGGYAGLAPVNGDLWNAAWSVPADLLRRHRGDIEALFREACDSSAALRGRFARAQRVGDWLSCPLPRYPVRTAWPDRVIPIGNAAAALEPVGGEGMGLAMRSAELAADAIHKASRCSLPVDSRSLRRAFDRLWRTRRMACRSGAVALSHKWLGPLTVGIGRHAPLLARMGLSLVGK